MTDPVPSLWPLEPLVPYVAVLIKELVEGRLDPASIPLPVQSDMTPWLDELEREVFDEAACRNKAERKRVRCDHGGFRIVRNLSDDNVALIAEWLRRVDRSSPADGCLRRLLDEFQAFEPIVPRQTSDTVQ